MKTLFSYGENSALLSGRRDGKYSEKIVVFFFSQSLVACSSCSQERLSMPFKEAREFLDSSFANCPSFWLGKPSAGGHERLLDDVS